MKPIIKGKRRAFYRGVRSKNHNNKGKWSIGRKRIKSNNIQVKVKNKRHSYGIVKNAKSKNNENPSLQKAQGCIGVWNAIYRTKQYKKKNTLSTSTQGDQTSQEEKESKEE